MKNQIDLDLLERIVKIPSLSQNHKACLESLVVLKDKLRQNKIPSQIGTVKGFPFLTAGHTGKNKTVFLSHIDVVPGKPNQFQLQEKQGKLIGRGVLDMKGPLTVALSAFIELWNLGLKNFLFVVTSDEEIGGFNGTAELSKKILKNIKNAIILDSVSGEKLVKIQKAPFHIKICHQGKSSHGSRPWEGINSVQLVADCSLNIVKQLSKNSPEETTAAITQIQGGNSINVIPNNAFSILDVRIKSKREISQIVRTINFLVQKSGCVWEKIDQPLFVEISTTNPLLQTWISSFKKNTGKNCEIATESGASDARFLVSPKVPAIITSAEGGGAHSENEWVSLKSLIQLQNILLNFVKCLQTGPTC